MKLKKFTDFYDAWYYLDNHPYFKFDGIEYFE